MSPRSIIITASDDAYAPLAHDLLRSLRRLKIPFVYDIGILDLGLSENNKTTLAALGASFKKPGIDIDYPGREAWEKDMPFYRAMTSRPFLRDYFPGYDAYMWMDADTWAQTPDAVATMLPLAASSGTLCIASEFDRDYRPYFDSAKPWEYHLKWYQANYPAETVGKIFPRPMLNCGVMALAANSPVWARWADTLGASLKSLPRMSRDNFMSEQLALNVAIYTENLPVNVMPAEFNWLTLYALPMLDENGLYVRPTPPRTSISVIHITHQGKLRAQKLATAVGKTLERELTFSAYEQRS